MNARQEGSIQATLAVEVLCIVNQLVDHRMMLFNGLEPVMPDGMWRRWKFLKTPFHPVLISDGIARSWYAWAYDFSVETKSPPFLLTDGILDCLLRWGQGQARFSPFGFTSPPYGAGEAYERIEQVSAHRIAWTDE